MRYWTISDTKSYQNLLVILNLVSQILRWQHCNIGQILPLLETILNCLHLPMMKERQSAAWAFNRSGNFSNASKYNLERKAKNLKSCYFGHKPPLRCINIDWESWSWSGDHCLFLYYDDPSLISADFQNESNKRDWKQFLNNFVTVYFLSAEVLRFGYTTKNRTLNLLPNLCQK